MLKTQGILYFMLTAPLNTDELRANAYHIREHTSGGIRQQTLLGIIKGQDLGIERDE